MKQTVRLNLLRYAATIFMGIAFGGLAHGQTPTPAAPMSVTDPSLNNPMARALEPVRQAIGRQDYAAAQAALDEARKMDPDHPGVALYESLINRRQTQGQVLDTESPLRTPRAGITPIPTQAVISTPVPAIPVEETPAAATPAEQPEAAPLASVEGVTAKAKELWQNDMVKYAVYGVAGLILLLIIFSLFKKRRDRTEEIEEPVQKSPMSTGVTTMGGLDDHLGDEEEPQGSFGTFNPGLGASTMGAAGGGLAASSTSPDFSPTGSASTGFEAPSAGTPGAMGGSALSGGGMAGYSMPSFHSDDDEEEAPAPPPKPVARKPVDDDALVNIFGDDEPENEPVAPPAPKAVSDDVSLESLGVNSSANTPEKSQPTEPPKAFDEEPTVILPGSGSTPKAVDEQPTELLSEEDATPKAFDEEPTMMLSDPDIAPLPPATPTAPVNPTPTSTPSVAPGTVDLEDIFGSQPLPASDTRAEGLHEPAKAEDKLSGYEEKDTNSETLPTFVSTPGADNPEDNMETPPPTGQRQKPEAGSETDSISFEQLFGSPDETTSIPAAKPEPTPAPAPSEPTPEPASSSNETSIEDALAATLGAMQAEAPDEAPAAQPSAAEIVGASTESLDDRTERMFSDQINKAKGAVADKNWRQAVHFLSIASALHPENEEAKQLLKDARAEKRKSEESV